MQGIDLVGLLRRKQRNAVMDEDTQQYYTALMRKMQVENKGSICPPWPDQLDPIERVNACIYWFMAHLLQEIVHELKTQNPSAANVSEFTIVDLFTEAPTTSNVRSHPIFELLEQTLDHVRATGAK